MAYAFIDAVAAGNTTSGAKSTLGASSFFAVLCGIGPTISDSQSNTWIPLTGASDRIGAFSSELKIYYCEAPTTNANHTFTPGGSTVGLTVAWFSGGTTSSFDQEVGGSSDTSTSATMSSLTPTNDNQVIITGLGSLDSTGTVSINGGFTVAAQIQLQSGVNFSAAIAYLIQGSKVAAAPTWTGDAAPFAGPLFANGATFTAAAGGATGQPTTKRWGGAPHMGTQKLRGGHRGGPWGQRQSGVIVPREYREAA